MDARHPETRKILEHEPGWIISAGISVIFIFIILILALTFFIRYPDVLKGKILLTVSNQFIGISALDSCANLDQPRVILNKGDKLVRLQFGEETFDLVSTDSGVAYFPILMVNGRSDDSPIAGIDLTKKDELQGYITMARDDAERIQSGQHVKVYFDDFHFDNFKYLAGNVEAILRMPGQTNYRVKIGFTQRDQIALKAMLQGNLMVEGRFEIKTDASISARVFNKIFPSLKHL